jgi:glutamate transport system substrate-binding protein
VTRKQRLLLPALVLALAMLGAACGDDDEPTISGGGGGQQGAAAPTFPAGSTMANIQAKGRLVVGIKFDQPGLGVKNPATNKLAGFDADIARLMAVGIFGGSVDDIDSKIEFKEAPTPQRELLIQNGTVDMVVATYTINDARKQQIDFAGPYFIAGQDIMVKAENDSIRTVDDLNGKKVCSVRNSTPAQRIRQRAPQADLTEFDTYTLCKDALLDGRVEAVSTDNVILIGFVEANPDKLKILNNRFSDEPYGIGLKKGDDAFRTFLNDRLEQIYRSGEWARAFEFNLGKFGLQTPTPPPVDRYQSTGAAVPATTATTAAGGATTTTVATTTTTR